MTGKILVYLTIPLLASSGCAFVNVPLVPPKRPLQEQVIAGSGKDKILLLDISGIISIEEKSKLGGIAKEPSLVARVKEELLLAQKDDDIKALVLKINSPGGMVTASDILHHEINSFKKQKGVKVVACLMELSTSGGYYVATAADLIVSHPTTITGSIGVMVLKLSLADLMQKMGVQEETIKSGDKKDILVPYRSISEEEREIVQQIVDQLQKRFLQIVREGRPNITKAQLAQIADGRILSSQQARELGLIDQIGYLDEAIEGAKQLAGLAEARVIRYQPPLSDKANIYTQAKGLAPQPAPSLNTYLSGLLPSPYFMYLWMP